MPKKAAGLTLQDVERKPPGLWADGGGLYLRVTASGNRAWVSRYQLDGKRHDMGLGPVEPGNGIREARSAVYERRALVRQGIDPLAAKAARKAERVAATAAAFTFKEVAEQYVTAHEAEWRSHKSLAAWRGTLRDYAFPAFGDLPVSTIDVPLVLKAIESIWITKTETAKRLRGRIESILDFAKGRGYRKGDNPAAWKGNLDQVLAKPSRVAPVEHYSAAAIDDMPAIMGQLAAIDSVGARALRFAILTGARTGEVLGARWGEFDMEERLWTVPKERMKANREHRVPLSAAAVAIVEEMAKFRSSDYVFPGQREGQPLSDMALMMMLRRMTRGDLTVHGFRSTFRDWAAERTNFQDHVAEMALAHTVADKVEAAYRRGELLQKRRELAEAWAAHCDH